MDPLGPTLRRTRRREHPAWRVLLAIAVSLVANLLVVTQLDARWLGLFPLTERRDVALAPLTADAWEANRQVRPGQQAATPRAEPPKRIERPAPPGMVVKVDESAAKVKEIAPKDSKFVSDRDRTVEKETKAKLVPGNEDLPIASGAVGGATSGADGKSRRTVVAAAGPQVPAGKAVDHPPRPGEDPAKVSGELAAALTLGGGAEGEALEGRFDPRLQLAPSTVSKVLGRSVGQGLDDVDEGDGTFLNTREWKYATYFHRIYDSVVAAWRPIQAIDKRDPERSIFMDRDRITVLSVTIDDRGGIKDIRVVRSSNVDFLDKVAIRAFEDAQPFMNPPAGVLNERGELNYVFGFTIRAARPGLHLYRGPAPF